MHPFTKPSARAVAADPASLLRDESDTTSLQRVDDANAVVRPDGIGPTYKELEFDDRAAEQRPLHAAEGEAAALQHAKSAAGLELRKDTAQHLVGDHLPAVARARDRFEGAISALGTFRVRGYRAKAWYSLRTTALLAGDIAGISGAAISMGEIPANAYLLAASASVATIAAGLVGKDVRNIYLRRRRAGAVEQLSADQKPYQHLFTAEPGGLRMLRGVVVAAAAVGIILGLGLYGLRTSIEGSLSGLVFGSLALAVAIGSFLSSFAYGDEIADLIDNARHDYEVELRRANRLAGSRSWTKWRQHDVASSQLRAEYDQRGQAAKLAVSGAKWRLLSRNPAVVGHAPMAARPEAIGLKRREGDPR